MVDRRKRLHRDLVEQLTKDWPDLLPIAIPSSAAVERMGVERAPVAAFALAAGPPWPTGSCGRRWRRGCG